MSLVNLPTIPPPTHLSHPRANPHRQFALGVLDLSFSLLTNSLDFFILVVNEEALPDVHTVSGMQLSNSFTTNPPILPPVL